jgi:hypothetical protein
MVILLDLQDFEERRYFTKRYENSQKQGINREFEPIKFHLF